MLCWCCGHTPEVVQVGNVFFSILYSGSTGGQCIIGTKVAQVGNALWVQQLHRWTVHCVYSSYTGVQHGYRSCTDWQCNVGTGVIWAGSTLWVLQWILTCGKCILFAYRPVLMPRHKWTVVPCAMLECCVTSQGLSEFIMEMGSHQALSIWHQSYYILNIYICANIILLNLLVMHHSRHGPGFSAKKMSSYIFSFNCTFFILLFFQPSHPVYRSS